MGGSSGKIRVAYDHQIFCWQEYGGISRYFLEVARRIQGFDGYDVRILCPLFVNKYLRDDHRLAVMGTYVRYVPRTLRFLQALNAAIVRRTLRRTPPDVIHETFYRNGSLASSDIPTVTTVHDMIHEKFPQFFRADDRTRHLKQAAVARADHIICVSENTRADLIELYGVDAKKTSVIHLGGPSFRGDGIATPDGVNSPYVAYVGARGGYKNFGRLLHAFSLSQLLSNNFSIVCFGGGGFTAAEREEIRKYRLKAERIVYLEGPDEVLGGIYRNAAAFVCPSLYEGFGLPLLEAMTASCPVVCSETSSLPEVCGSAAEYFDPYSPESMAQSIGRVVESQSRRSELIDLGLQRVQSFSWDDCAKQTAAVYASIV